MFKDDNWGLIAFLASIFGAFFIGKEQGVKQTVRHFEEQAVIKEQQAQIALLHAKIDELTRNMQVGIIVRNQ